MNAKLGGYLVGYGLKKRNGEEKRVIFDRPIHNTITKHCLNNLLTLDGTNSLPAGNFAGNWYSQFVKSTNTSDRYGVFNSCCLGDGTGDTSVNDTDLKHRVTTQTTTKKTGAGWCQTTYINASAIKKIRISHVHSIDTDFTIKEIGWYNAVNSGGSLNYTLSSRVQLDEFVDVEAGDEFYSIYEITISFQDIERFTDLAGLGSGYKVNMVNVTVGNNDWLDSYSPTILNNGNPNQSAFNNGDYNRPVHKPIYLAKLGVPYQSLCLLQYNKSNINKLKTFWAQANMNSFVNTTNTDVNVLDYEQDSFRRDCEFVTAFNNVTGVYSIVVNGTMYRFGDFDENDNFTPITVTLNGSYKIKFRESWSTDLLTPTP